MLFAEKGKIEIIAHLPIIFYFAAMLWLQFVFWLSLGILFYCFVGYTIVLWVATFFKQTKEIQAGPAADSLPEVTIVIAAYNEKDFIEEKIKNTLSLTYPAHKIKWLFITDGSDDGTAEIIKKYPQITLLHQAERKGKSAALNRAMQFVTTPVTIFSDANTLLNKEAVTSLVKHYADETVGGVSGEKKIETKTPAHKSGMGEGLYWLYESQIKKLESKFYSLVGSAGELFSIRTALFKTIPGNIILDDFFTALSINQQGYKIVYESQAVSTETPSASLADEQKRKVRIASGAFQVAFKFGGLINFFKQPAFAFQFLSHKILRWFFAPACLVALFIASYFLSGNTAFYKWFWYAQLLFYILALLGWIFQKQKKIIPAFYFPFYFLFMNWCTVLGWYSYISGKSNVLWDKSKRVNTR